MNNLKEAFATAREILANDTERGLTATFAEKLVLYRMARTGIIVWRCTVDDSTVRGFLIGNPAF